MLMFLHTLHFNSYKNKTTVFIVICSIYCYIQFNISDLVYVTWNSHRCTGQEYMLCLLCSFKVLVDFKLPRLPQRITRKIISLFQGGRFFF